jgi:hypothetical protein
VPVIMAIFPSGGGPGIGLPELREAREGKRSRKAPKTVRCDW